MSEIRTGRGITRKALVLLLIGFTASCLIGAAVACSGASQQTDGTVQPQNGGEQNAQGDEAVKAGVEAIAKGCSEFAGQYGYGPSADDVWAEGRVAQFVDPWPENPYTGQPMAQSDSPGDFTFYSAIRMNEQEYLGYVYGHLSNGEDCKAEYEY